MRAKTILGKNEKKNNFSFIKTDFTKTKRLKPTQQ